MKIQLKSYLQFKFHATGVIFTMVTMFPHFPPKCGACVTVDILLMPSKVHFVHPTSFTVSAQEFSKPFLVADT